jgi:hypothetical protein
MVGNVGYDGSHDSDCVVIVRKNAAVYKNMCA